MSERLVRLHGPATLTGTPASPTTLFTVPAKKLYILRRLEAVTPAQAGGVTAAGVVLGKTNLALGNRTTALAVSSSASPIASFASVDMAVPFTEGEVVVAGWDSPVVPANWNDPAGSGATSSGKAELLSGAGVGAWVNKTTTDATTITATCTPFTLDLPVQVFFLAVNSKATTPDTITSITDAHTTPMPNGTSIVTAATAGIRASIWGSSVAFQPTSSASYTVTFGGTFTGAYVSEVVAQLANYAPQAPATTNTVLQTATATGTTEVSQGVTMTPLSGNSFQILIVATNGSTSAYSFDDANGTEWADETLATPSTRAAAYVISPSVTNPSATIAGAGTDWAAVCIEVGLGSAPDITLSGLIIEN